MDKSWIMYSQRPSLKSYMVRTIIKLFGRVLRNKDLLQTRRLWDTHAETLKIPPDYEVQAVNLAGIDCEWIQPKNCKVIKTVIYLHGGGYVLGSLPSARGFALPLSKYSGQKVLSVGYRLAPENPFPAALDDSLTVYTELLSQNINPSDIILVGDSAGGGLSLATVLALKEKGIPLPGAVVCISPWTDLAATGGSNKANAKLDPIFGKGGGAIKPEDYAGKVSLFNPFVSPLYGDYVGFPPLSIHVGTHEVILDDSIRLAEKARAAGVQTSLKVWKGMWHVFPAQHNSLPEGKQAFKEIGDFIKDPTA